MEYSCQICLMFFDLDDQLPMTHSCGCIYCKSCSLKRETENCWVCGSIYERPASIYINIREAIKKLNMFCQVHQKYSLRFILNSESIVCDDCLLGKDSDLIGKIKEESIEIEQLEATISGHLKRKYLNTKEKLSKPARKYITSFMGKGVLPAYRAIKFLNLYNTENVNCGNLFHPTNTKSDLFLNKNDFTIICEVCLNPDYEKIYMPLSGDLKFLTQSILDELNKKSSFRHLIWNSLISSETQQPNNELARLAEAAVILDRKFSININSLACGKCGKVFGYGFRFPLVLECFHVKCFACYLNDKNCEICGQAKKITRSLEGCGFDLQQLRGEIKCVWCKKDLKIRESLPFHSICGCIVCEKCTRLPLKFCECNSKISFDNRLHFKISKLAISNLIHESRPACDECGGDCISFNSVRNIFLCGQHSFGDSNVYEDKVNLVKLRKLKDLFSSIGEDLISDEYIEKICEFVLPFELKYIKNKASPIYIKSYHSLYKHIYPITTKDQRFFDTEKLKKFTYTMTIEASEEIELLGLIICGSISQYELDSVVRINVKVLGSNNSKVEKEVLIEGPAGFVDLNKKVFDRMFRIKIRFFSKYLIFSGSCLAQSNSWTGNHGINFLAYNGYKDKELLFGPILGFTYKHFL